MALKVVGSGLGRTGTLSLKHALEQLGFAPCHHMVEVFAKPESVSWWVDAGEGRPDWDRIFEGYSAAVDYPTAAYWRELAAHYPDAKVLHTVRDPDSWFDSTQATIFAPGGGVDAALTQPDSPMSAFFLSFSGRFRDNVHDRAFMTDYFRRHSAEVKATIAPERLLVYEVGSGWEPLCEFFGVRVPSEAYPSENTRADFQARVAAARAAASNAQAS